MKIILIVYFIFAVAWMGCKEEKKDTTKPFTGKIVGDSVYVDGYSIGAYLLSVDSEGNIIDTIIFNKQ